MTTELETNIVAVERVKEYTETPTEVNSSYFIYISLLKGVVSEMTTELETNIVAVESEGIHRNSYRGVVSENDSRVRETNIVAVERVKEYTETPTEGVVSENDNRVRDKHCSCRESEGIHRNSYRGVVSENDRSRLKRQTAVESEGIHRNSTEGSK
ncbi:unnamed protein product [Mytilus edulis]|uniref:Uncharacterized protein n=1 Tax=Mytilus edulis TaxID=6550 RepID=A0A8S3T7V8_MYTED|nr:unnamed protein product [Mytilus edulis]